MRDEAGSPCPPIVREEVLPETFTFGAAPASAAPITKKKREGNICSSEIMRHARERHEKEEKKKKKKKRETSL